MANQRRILPVLLLIAVLGTISWLVLRPYDPEPIYKGKPLTYWLDGFLPRANSADPPSQDEAEEAVQQIGTNAIPTLLRMLRAKDSEFKLKLIQLTQKQHLINIKWRMAETQRYEALIAFTYLGPQGQSAVPDLIQIDRESRSDPKNDYRSLFDMVFASMGPAAAAAVPLLVQDTADPNYLIRWSVVQTLGKIHANSNLSVPALAKSLRDPVADVRRDAAHSLAAFGTNAQSATPELINLLFDPSPDVSAMAASALKQIDPAAATNAIANANSFKLEKF
jgi:hypothetical protein